MRNWISSGVNQYVWYIILSGFCMINSEICLSSITPKNFIEDFLSISLLFSFIFGGIFIGWCRAVGGMGVGGGGLVGCVQSQKSALPSKV